MFEFKFICLFQTKNVQNAMNEGNFEEAVKLRGKYVSLQVLDKTFKPGFQRKICW